MSNQKSPYYSLENIERLLKVERVIIRKIADRVGAYYNPYDIKQIKRDGRIKWRHIDNPNIELKYLQKRILKKILTDNILLLPSGMIGGVAGKSIKDNALPHVNQEMVVTIDIKDCFPSITNNMVFKVWRNTINCGTRPANLLTKLTTFRTILPQGAPTSTALCNFVLIPLFEDINTYAIKNNIAFTLYVDDITLSGKAINVLPAMSIVIRLIQKYGFGVKREKIGVMPANVRQMMTGLISNKKVNVARDKIIEVRSEILEIKRRGNGITNTEKNSIDGNIRFVKSVSNEKAEKLRLFAEMLLPENFIENDESKDKLITRKCRHHKNY